MLLEFTTQNKLLQNETKSTRKLRRDPQMTVGNTVKYSRLPHLVASVPEDDRDEYARHPLHRSLKRSA